MWERLSAGVYRLSGGRYRIMRRGPSVWILIDNKTGREMRFDFLEDAQSRAHWELAEEAKNAATGNSEGPHVV
jgi:hypothetical protein